MILISHEAFCELVRISCAHKGITSIAAQDSIIGMAWNRIIGADNWNREFVVDSVIKAIAHHKVNNKPIWPERKVP